MADGIGEEELKRESQERHHGSIQGMRFSSRPGGMPPRIEAVSLPE